MRDYRVPAAAFGVIKRAVCGFDQIGGRLSAFRH
jgi:hypothetical protein